MTSSVLPRLYRLARLQIIGYHQKGLLPRIDWNWRKLSPRIKALYVFAFLTLPGLVVFPAASQEVSEPADYFAKKVWHTVLEQKCLKCHKTGGDAEDSKFVLKDPAKDLSAAQSDSMEHNRTVFDKVSKWKEDDDWLVLLKVIDEIPHDGGEVLDRDSYQLSILRSYVRGINGEQNIKSIAAYEQGPFFEGVSMLDNARLLRRLTLSLAGRLPTSREQKAISEKPDLDTIDVLLDGILKEDAFYERLAEGFNDIFLTRGYEGVPERALSYEHFSETRNWTQKFSLSQSGNEEAQTKARYRLTDDYREAMLREPTELVKFIVRENRPFTEIVTADYWMVSPYTARGYGIYDEVSAKFKDPKTPFEYIPVRLKTLVSRDGRSDMPSESGFYPHAGLLSSFQYLMRYPTTETNRNRLRSRMFYLHFLGIDVMELAPRVNDAAAITTKYDVPTMEASDCVVCHKTIDPLSGLFQDFYVVDAKGVYGPRKDGWYEDMFRPGFEGEAIPGSEKWRSLQWLGEITAADPRFAVTMTEHVYYIMTGRKVLRAPENTEHPFYEARFRAWREQREVVDEIAETFAGSEFNLKSVFKSWAKSPFYRADGLAATVESSHREAELADVGLVRMLPPEQLERKLEAIFGEGWGRLDEQFAILYGGIDSKTVTERIGQPNGAMGAIQRMLANEMACRHVVPDFAQDPSKRRLFPGIEPHVIPGESEAGDRQIREAIAHLHRYLLGLDDAIDSPEVALTFQLFANIIADAEDGDGFEELDSNSCGRINNKRVEDSFYSLRAWRGVVTYLMRRRDFLYE